MATKKIEIQDHQGNVYYPHTTVDVVFMKDGRKAEDVICLLYTSDAADE